ncbi:class I SAM-dependent methyltransferase [Methylophilales bacterium]|nr:class I SAM-dependent methyltransferase [Methylophilales bacterium]
MKKYSDIWSQSRKLKSDKWEHYFEIYDHCLSKFYEKKISFLEIGIQNGGSLEVAQKLFSPKSLISGLDIDKQCANLSNILSNVNIFIGSQSDEKILNKIVSEHNKKFDVIIDDGSHLQSDMIFTFTRLFQFLNDGGVYLIEDTHTNYSPLHQESFFGIGLYDYFKGISERLNLDYMDPQSRQRFKIPREQRESKNYYYDISHFIYSVEFFDSVIAIRKKQKLEPLRIQK